MSRVGRGFGVDSFRKGGQGCLIPADRGIGGFFDAVVV